MKFYEEWDARRGPKAADRPLAPTITSTSTTAYGRRALDAEVARVALAPEGSRNGTLNEASFAIFQLVDAGEIDDGEAREALATAARRAGLTPHEIMRTIGSARTGASRNPRRKLPERSAAQSVVFDLKRESSGEPVFVHREEPSGAQGAAQGLPEADDGSPYDELYVPRSKLRDLPRGEPLIDGVIDRHTYFAVVGRDQSFKSFLVLDWLLCLSTGRPWLGHATTQTKTLYVVGEGAFGLDDRVTAWERNYETVSDEWFVVRRAPVNLHRQSNEYLDLLERIERDKFGIVVFDTLQRMSGGAEQNSSRDAGIIVDALDRVRKTADGSVGIVAHSQKDDRDLRGSSSFEDDADIVWRVKRDEEEQSVHVSLDKRKDGPAGLAYELFPRSVSGVPSLILQSHKPIVSNEPKPLRKWTREVLRVLAGAAVGAGGMSPTSIRNESGMSSTGGLYGVLNDLVERGWVDKTESGIKVNYWITSDGRSTLAKLDGKTEDDQGE